MRGVVLLLDADGTVEPDMLRAEGLFVLEAADPAHALACLEDVAPDVIVAVLSQDESPRVIADFRASADYATSIIVLGSEPRQRAAARQAGADAFILASADLLYEIHKALILRRSGRRLSWNG